MRDATEHVEDGPAAAALESVARPAGNADAELRLVRRDIKSMIGMRSTMAFTEVENHRWADLLDHELRLMSA